MEIEPKPAPTDVRGHVVRLWTFLTRDLWRIELGSLDRMRRILVRTLQVGALVVRGFKVDHCPLQASRLSYLTLISIVPVLAVGFGVLQGFGLGEPYLAQIEDSILEIPEQPREFVLQVLAVVRSTNHAGMTSIGVAAFLILVIRMLFAVETAFNRIWGVRTHRGVRTWITSYISVLVLVPVLLVAAGALYGQIQYEASRGWLQAFPFTAHVLNLLPWLAVWLAFAVVYILVPNTQVQFRAGVAGALLAAVAWLIWQRLYVSLQLGVVRLGNPVYASFMTVPIFLIWVYNSWLIVLLGAETAFALQNVNTFALEHGAQAASPRARLALALDLLEAAARAQEGAAPDLLLPAFANARQVPIRLLNELADTLGRLGLLVEAASPPDTWVLQRRPESIRIADLVAALLTDGDDASLRGLRAPGRVSQEVLSRIQAGMRARIEDLTLAELLVPPEPSA